MDLALLQLLALRMRGSLRTRLNQLFTVRGIVYFGISCLVPLLIWFGLFQANAVGGGLDAGLPGQIESLMVLGLVAATLLSLLTVTSPAFHFSPEEVNFLGAAPFSHQSLLLYKLLSSASGAVLTALFLTVVTGGIRGRLPAAIFFGSLLTLLFLQLTRATLRSSLQLVGRKVPTYRRRRSLPLLAISLGVLAWPLFTLLRQGPIEVLLAFCDTQVGEYMLLPFKTFVRMGLADRIFPDLVHWLALGVAINLGMLSLLLRLERVIDAQAENGPFDLESERELERRMATSLVTSAATARMMACRLGGLGPLAWRQMFNARRSAGTAILMLIALGIAGGPLLVHGLSNYSVPARIGIVLTFAIFILPKAIVFDFRGDAGGLQWLRGLPLRPAIIVLGQLTTPVVLTSCIELLALLGAICLLDGSAQHRLAALLPFVVPFNVLLYSIENLMFLLVPFRLVPTGRIDFEFFGRSVIEVLAKMLLLALVIIAASGAGRMGSQWLGGSSLAFYAITWLVMNLTAAVGILIVAWAFQICESNTNR